MVSCVIVTLYSIQAYNVGGAMFYRFVKSIDRGAVDAYLPTYDTTEFYAVVTRKKTSVTLRAYASIAVPIRTRVLPPFTR